MPTSTPSPSSLPANVAVRQNVAGLVSKGWIREPGRQNIWDLTSGFGLTDGGDDQFDHAMRLKVEVGGTVAYFPSDQTYAELTALGPDMDASDGVTGVSILSTAEFDPGLAGVSGHYGVVHAGPPVRLQTTLDLTAAMGGIALTWSGTAAVGVPMFIAMIDPAPYRQVVVRELDGTLLSTLFREDASGLAGTWGSASLTAFAGRTVVLSFEQRAATGAMLIDSVAAVDAHGTAFVANGDFEALDSGWTVQTGRMSCNVCSGVRTLLGLDVQRSFYAQPNQLWGRLTDTFHNPGTSAVDAFVDYESMMGSDNSSVFYPTPGTDGIALTVWDTYSDSDVGLVFGEAHRLRYRSATGLRMRDGFKDLSFGFNLRVAAGATVTLVNFVVLGSEESGRGATNILQRLPQVDHAVNAIVKGFRTDPLYRRGLTPLQWETVQNL